MFMKCQDCGFYLAEKLHPMVYLNVLTLALIVKSQIRMHFLVKVDDKLAGFVLINKVGSTPEVDWNIGEFFIVFKFQGKGVGRCVA